MKKGAILALAVLLLAALIGVRAQMGCDVTHELRTSDGVIFRFQGPKIVPGTLDNFQPLDSRGLPPVEHIVQQVYGMAGALLKSTETKPRTVTFTTTMHGLTTKDLYQIKAKLNDAMRPDRGAKGDRLIYRQTVDGVARDLYVQYSGEVTRTVGRFGSMEVVGIRFTAYDPFWYDPVTQEQVLDWQDGLTYRLVATKTGGVWDAMGPPAAVAAGAGGNTAIYVMKASPDDRYVYFGGDFQTFDNIPAGNHIVRWDTVTRTWAAVGGGLNHIVRDICFGPDGTLYVVGTFTDGSGGVGDGAADYIAQLDTGTDTWVNVGGGPGAGAVTTVNAMLIGADGALYLGGDFTDWDGIGAADYIVTLPLPYAAGGWASLGAAALDLTVESVAMLHNGHIVATGNFSVIGAVPHLRIAEWDPVALTWSTLGTGFNQVGRSLAVGANGILYAGGFFTTAGGVPCIHIAQWNGTTWSPMGDGLTNGAAYVVRVIVNPVNAEVYATGVFADAGGVAFADNIAKWNGSTWTPIDIVVPAPAGVAARFAFNSVGDIYVGLDSSGTLVVGADNSVVNAGSVATLPIIEIKNQGILGIIRNETMDYDIPCNMQIQDGEIVTIDLSVGIKSCESTWRGNRLGDILPNSDMGSFCLESNPRAAQGANLITVFITGAAGGALYPRESGDNNNQLAAWEVITGIAQSNTDLGRLYVNIVAEGAGVYHVDLYMDPPKAAGDLVGHSDSYNAPGAVNINPDNGSGLGGQILIDAVVGADTDIEVWFTIVTMFWRNRWWDLDSAVS